MLDEEIMKEAKELADYSEDAVIPMMLIGPTITTERDDWLKIIYSFLVLKKSLEQRMNLKIQATVIDCDEDVGVDVLDRIGLDPSEIELKELRDNGCFEP